MLSDPGKRRKFDAGQNLEEIESGHPGFDHDHFGGGGGFHGGGFDFSDLFGDMGGGGGGFGGGGFGGFGGPGGGFGGGYGQPGPRSRAQSGRGGGFRR